MKYKTFYSRDCLMYGVQALKANVNYTGDPARWVQVLPPQGKGARRGQSAYTYYKGVANRWKTELEARDRLEYLRAELDAERIDLSELSEIEQAFSELPDESLRDLRENATASDMLDELEEHTK